MSTVDAMRSVLPESWLSSSASSSDLACPSGIVPRCERYGAEEGAQRSRKIYRRVEDRCGDSRLLPRRPPPPSRTVALWAESGRWAGGAQPPGPPCGCSADALDKRTSIPSAMASSRSALSGALRAAQGPCVACFAASIACLTSSSPPRATAQITCALAGLRRSKRPPPAAGTNLPSMKWSTGFGELACPFCGVVIEVQRGCGVDLV